MDEEALRATVTAAWRKAHGRLTYPLVEKIKTSLPDETFTVSVWLTAEIEPLLKPMDEAALQPSSRRAVRRQTRSSRDDSPNRRTDRRSSKSRFHWTRSRRRS